MRILTAVVALSLLTGCFSFNLNTEEAISDIQQAASSSINVGLSAAVPADKVAATKQKVATVVEFMDATVIPFFENKPLKSITRNTANEVLALLDDKLSPALRAGVQLALNAGLALINLPDNPAAKLNQNQRDLILGVLNGIRNGLHRYLTSPRAVPGEEPPPAVKKITWDLD